MDTIAQTLQIDMAIQLFGFLLLTILGLVVPIVAILLSVFRDGIVKLATQYESEKLQSENNIKEQLKSLTTAADTDTSAVRESLKALEHLKKTAQNKLSYLSPKKQILRLFIPLLIAFLLVLATLWIEAEIYNLLLLISLAAFAYAVIVLWRLLSIIVEVKAITDTDRQNVISGVMELLTKILEKTGTTELQYFLQRVLIRLDGINIKNDQSFSKTLHVNKKAELEVAFDNDESRMAKKVEVGFNFPTNFFIDRIDGYYIYSATNYQIVRFSVEEVQAKTLHIFTAPLTITPLEKGIQKIKTFIKAENIEPVRKTITIDVV